MHTFVFGCVVRYVPKSASEAPYVELCSRVLPVHVDRAGSQRVTDLLVRSTERVRDLEAVRVEHVCRHLRHQLLFGKVLAADGQLRAIAAGLCSGRTCGCRSRTAGTAAGGVSTPACSKGPGYRDC